jgi:hypothetical protein
MSIGRTLKKARSTTNSGASAPTTQHTHLEAAKMNWEAILDIRLDTIGENPTDDQINHLVAWAIDNIPSAYWRSVAPWMPSSACERLMMHGAECGY